jgi:hypothetical protein
MKTVEINDTEALVEKRMATTTVERFRNASSVNDLIRLLRGDAGLGDFRLVCTDDGKVAVKLLDSVISVQKGSDECMSEFVLGDRSDLLPVLFRFDNLFYVRSKVEGFVPTLEELGTLPISKARNYLSRMKEADERIAWPLVERQIKVWDSSMSRFRSEDCPKDVTPGYQWYWVDNLFEAGWLEVDLVNRRQGAFHVRCFVS